MTNVDYDACYATLQLKSGASLREIHEAWRRLSRSHHPDQHTRDPRAYKQALEMQKRINNARDVLKKWFEHNPSIPPPRTSNSQSTTNGANDTRHRETQSRTTRSTQSSESTRSTTDAADTNLTGWFKSSTLNLSPLQNFVRTLTAKHSQQNRDHIAIMQIATTVGAIFGPMWIIVSVLRQLFPDMPPQLPDWLQLAVLCVSGYISWYLFRWFFTEAELITLQDKPLYFKTTASVTTVIHSLQAIVAKQPSFSDNWRFVSDGNGLNAVIEYEEQLAKDFKRPRRLALRFAAKQVKRGTLIALEIRANSPINSFSCNSLAKSIVSALKAEFTELAA